MSIPKPIPDARIDQPHQLRRRQERIRRPNEEGAPDSALKFSERRVHSHSHRFCIVVGEREHLFSLSGTSDGLPWARHGESLGSGIYCHDFS